jgi:hypothetical protein
MYQIDFSQTTFNSQQILVRGRRTLNSFSLQDKTTAWMVDYKIPFDMPIAKVKNRAVVEGTIIDTAKRQPVKDIMVQVNGLAMVTDRQGHFIFPALKPGHYYLTIECSNIGLQYVTDKKMPMELHLQDGDRYDLAIGVSPSASLAGTLLLMPHHSSNTIVEIDSTTLVSNNQFFIMGNRAGGSEPPDTAQGLANSAVELCRDTETLWRTTDKDGRFLFEGLRPGQWTCKIYQNNFPDNYYLENETFLVDLPAGSQKEMVIKALPKKRKIRMLDQP